MKTVSIGGRTDSAYLSITRSIIDVLPGKGLDLDSFFLANRTIKSSRTSGLLVSASFGANSILYAAWLGYIMGFWALIIHAAWCLSFVLLSRYAQKIYQHTSLHDFLGCRFGCATRRVASLCSIIGLLYFAGWEIAIAKSGVQSLLESAGMNLGFALPLVVAVTILFALLYTTIGGIKANGHIDFILNIVKILLLAIVVYALSKSVLSSSNLETSVFLPSMSTAIGGIGIIGFFTNMIFSISWQFVDNTSWQTISSGSKEEANVAKKTLNIASKEVFAAYILGTLLGVLLRVIPNLNSDNILGGIASSGMANISVVLCVIILLLLSMVSLIDGVGLSVAQTFLVDLRFGEKFKKINGYTLARVVTIVFGVIAAWGIQLLLGAIGKSVFDFVYIFIVAQLSLLGVVAVGLMSKNAMSKNMWISILVGALSGITTSICGGIYQLPALTEAAGAISAVSSVLVALILSRHLSNRVTKEQL